ncbi:hypothetical protein [Streptomyces albogriseolus]
MSTNSSLGFTVSGPARKIQPREVRAGPAHTWQRSICMQPR